MQRNNLRRKTISPLTQKIKAPQHLLRLHDREDEFNDEHSDGFRLPSLPSLPQPKWKNDDNVVSNSNSAATSVSWSQEVEDAATQKVEEQWMTIEKFFYEEEGEEDNQSLQGAILDECTQWKTQIPYFRIIGKNPACDNNTRDKIDSSDKEKLFDDPQNDEQLVEHSSLVKEREDSAEYKANIAKFEDVLNILTEYVISQLFPNESDTDSLSETLSDALKITPAPVHSNTRNSSRNSRRNWTEEASSPNFIENKSLSIRNRLLDTKSSLQTIKNDATYQEIQRRQKSSASKSRDNGGTGEDASKERLPTPHIGRNKLGTVFNEKIVVSPVPFVVSTRESFSTLKTIPIRFMNEDIFQGPPRHVSGFQNSARKPGTSRSPNIYSAWQAPVCPTVWPKNVRLAPIDTSTLRSSSRNRFAPSPVVLHCSKKPLSPISRPVIPKSARTTRVRNGDFLEIQGRHVVTDQSKLNWDYTPRTVSRSKKKKERTKGGKRA